MSSQRHVSHYVEHLAEFQSKTKKQKLLQQIQQFTTKSYKPVKQVELKADLGASHPDGRTINDSLYQRQDEIVDLLITEAMWDKLVTHTNNELALKRNTSTASNRSSTYRSAIRLEVKFMFYLTLALEQKLSGEVKKLAVLFKIAKAKYNFFMGVNRFFSLRSSFGFNAVHHMQPFCDELSVNFRKYWILADYAAVSVDELLDAYRVTPMVKRRATEKREPIPTVYIPRKPHKNGFLFYIACAKNSMMVNRVGCHSNPYILSMLVHSSFPQPTARQALLRFVDSISGSGVKLTIYADAAFGSENMLKKLSDKGHIATMSMSHNQSEVVWNLLERKTLGDHWNACKNVHGTILSYYNGISTSEKAHQCLITSQFVEKRIQRSFIRTPPSVVTTNNPTSNNIVTTTSSSSETATSSNTTTASTSAESEIVITRPVLEKLTLNKSKNNSGKLCLKSICELKNIRHGGRNKKDLITHILTCLSPNFANEKHKNLYELDTNPKAGFPLQHRLYKQHFNGVDLNDSFYYSATPKISGVLSWKAKITKSICTLAVHNAYQLYYSVETCSITDFRNSLFEKFLENNF